MFRIITHIERLLLVHDCVIVPNFGGFVLQIIPSVCDEAKDTFRPLRKEISFNSTLQHNDGLLSESYMSLHGVNYQQAQHMLEADVEQIKLALQHDKTLSLGVLGSFRLGSEGQTIFNSGETDLFSVSSYGLPVFHFPALASLQPEQQDLSQKLEIDKKKKDTFYIPVSRKLIRTAVASVAAVGLFLLISTPVKDVNQSAYTASFIPTEMVSYKAVPADVVDIAVADIQREAEKGNPSLSPAMIKPVDNVSLKTEYPAEARKPVKPEVKSKALASETVKSNPKMYHIVIASFPTEAQADEFIAGVDKKECQHVSKVVRDGKYRIYADKFDNREQAESYMATLRVNPKYKDAWLFICR